MKSPTWDHQIIPRFDGIFQMGISVLEGMSSSDEAFCYAQIEQLPAFCFSFSYSSFFGFPVFAVRMPFSILLFAAIFIIVFPDAVAISICSSVFFAFHAIIARACSSLPNACLHELAAPNLCVLE